MLKNKIKQESLWFVWILLGIVVILLIWYFIQINNQVLAPTPTPSAVAVATDLPPSDINPEATSNPLFRSLSLTCDNGSTMLLTYYSPDEMDALSNLTVDVFNNGTKTSYNMISAVSASGARYTTPAGEEEYSIWEHQGSFAFMQGETEITSCTLDTTNE